jgi:rhodanese-related sulfurtransferase
MSWKRVFLEAAILVLIATIAGAGTNLFRSEARKLAWTSGYAPAAAGLVPPVRPAVSVSDLLALAPLKDPSLIFLEIPGDTAYRLHQAGALFLDARRSEAFEQGRIEKAINIPVWEHDADQRIASLQARGIRPDAVIVTYCSGGACEDAAMLSNKLAQAGYFNLFLYQDGFPGWQAHSWPVAKGKQP